MIRLCKYSKSSGFTLIELSVVLLVVAVVMGAGISLISVGLTNLAYNNTSARLKVLQKALWDYRIAYNKLPSPADSSSYATSSASFGLSDAGSPDFTDTGVTFGMVPVRTLGLPDDMAFDGWGRRIRYAAATGLIQDNAFDTVGITETSNMLTVKNAAGGDLTTTAAYVLVSYGENGHGGRGGTTGTLLSSGSTNANEWLNCKCDATGAYDAGVDPYTFVQNERKPDPADALNMFDDVAVFATRAQLRDADE
jgi:prepilin-type N-terminal cleavage/methylation domain-containing protein